MKIIHPVNLIGSFSSSLHLCLLIFLYVYTMYPTHYGTYYGNHWKPSNWRKCTKRLVPPNSCQVGSVDCHSIFCLDSLHSSILIPRCIKLSEFADIWQRPGTWRCCDSGEVIADKLSPADKPHWVNRQKLRIDTDKAHYQTIVSLSGTISGRLAGDTHWSVESFH